MCVCMVHVSMMRYFSVTDQRTNGRTNKAILGVGYISQLCENIFPPLNMIAAVASSLLWKFQTPLRQTATHLFVLLTDDAYEYIAGIF